jgi:hypothetical protein
MPEENHINGEDVILTYEYKRGEVYSEELFEQKILFSGMNYHRNITPTDIDLFLDFGGKLFIYGEAKKAPAKLTTGQSKALIHLVNSHVLAGNIAVALFFQHDIPAPKPIYAKDQFVVAYYWNNEWRNPKNEITVHEFIKKMIDIFKNNHNGNLP